MFAHVATSHSTTIKVAAHSVDLLYWDRVNILIEWFLHNPSYPRMQFGNGVGFNYGTANTVNHAQFASNYSSWPDLDRTVKCFSVTTHSMNMNGQILRILYIKRKLNIAETAKFVCSIFNCILILANSILFFFIQFSQEKILWSL